MRAVFDIETDGLIENATKIHCLCYYDIDTGKRGSLTDMKLIAQFLTQDDLTLIGHKIITFDIPVSEKLLGIIITAKLVDTLGLSWYLYPERIKHGLEAWGDDVGVAKPVIADWSNQSVEDYVHRCSTDVEINRIIFDLMIKYLLDIYEDVDKVNRFIGYLTFKLECAREQEEVKWKLDVNKCQENLSFLEKEALAKTDILSDIMPVVVNYKEVSRPKAIYKKAPKPTRNNPEPVAELSIAGREWLRLLEEKDLPDYHLGTLRIPISEEKGNPRSFPQLKAWLFSLGWVPETFKYVKEKDGTQRAVPQISKIDLPEICDSITKLYEANPGLEVLEGLFILNHRIGILKAFLENKNEEGFIKAEIHGFTNTLRFAHSNPIVNLPTIPRPYWEQIRGCLIAPDDNHVLCGSDMSGLEDNTKRHYMYYYDPEYVKEMMEYAFDPHCDISVLSGKMSADEQTFYKYYDGRKEGKDIQRILDIYYAKGLTAIQATANNATGFTLEELLAMSPEDQAKQMKILKAARLKSKKVNFAGVYGAGPPKIALTASIPLSEAKTLHVTYWKRNWSVKRIGENCLVKTINGQMWLHNPISQFWYSLRVRKDAFSTLNQGTGVYCFDSWVRNVRKQGIKNCGQFHDEIISPVLKGTEEEHSQKLRNAIEWTNNELQLNVKLGISIDYGNSYADIH